MLIAHVSDFHLFAQAPETSLVRPDAAEAAARVVADIAAFSPAFDAVMLTGDLTDGGSAEDYALLRAVLAPIAAPVFVVPGNHDKRPTLRAAFDLPWASDRLLNFEAELGGLRVIGLDSLLDGRIEGRLEDETLDWLAGRLARGWDGPTCILVHHPPFPSGIRALDAMALSGGGRERLAALVRDHRGGPLHILSGHIHRPMQALWQGAFCAVAGSPAFQHALDLRPDAPEPGLAAEPYGYFIHRIGPEGVCVHRRPVALP